MIGYDITITNATPPSPSNHVPPSSIDCITNYTANADLSLQDHERNKLNRSGLGITHAFSTLIINSFKMLVHSQTSPAFDHYDFLLPRDQIVGLLLDNSLAN
jgi:hypothetical protein